MQSSIAAATSSGSAAPSTGPTNRAVFEPNLRGKAMGMKCYTSLFSLHWHLNEDGYQCLLQRLTL